MEGIKKELEKLLTYYCRVEDFSYRQGLNEIAAPFIYFRKAGVSLGSCYSLFDSFFKEYCLNFYYDDVELSRYRTSIQWSCS